MDALTTAALPGVERDAARLRAFKATDALVVETFVALRVCSKGDEGRELARETRRSAARAAAALVAGAAAAADDPEGLAALRAARSAALEMRYYLYLARRLGMLESRRYRELGIRHDAALREIDAALQSRVRNRAG